MLYATREQVEHTNAKCKKTNKNNNNKKAHTHNKTYKKKRIKKNERTSLPESHFTIAAGRENEKQVPKYETETDNLRTEEKEKRRKEKEKKE